MKKSKLIAPVLAASIALSASFAGCSLVTPNNAADMQQVIATVNISGADGVSPADKQLFDNYQEAVGTTKIIKRELMAYYLNAGTSLVQSGMSYSNVFNMLVNGLIENAVVTQYAVMYLLDAKATEEGKSSEVILQEYTSKATYAEKLEYLLDEDDINLAKYTLYSMLNSALDSYEQEILDEDESKTGTGTRTAPKGVDAEQDDFYPAATAENAAEGFAVGELYYNVYTGYTGYQLKDSGLYKDDALKDSTRSTRVRAYNEFMRTLKSNSIIDPATEDVRDILEISYVQSEYENQLKNRVLSKYYDLYEAEQESKVTDGGEYAYLQEVYDAVLRKQSTDYKSDDAFASAIGSISDSSFILYAPDTEGEGTYGMVYNILLPYNERQSLELSSWQKNSDYFDSDKGHYTIEYYQKRNGLLKEIKTVDQREAWFNGATKYAFDATEAGLNKYFGKDDGRNWLFFENNLVKTDRYDSLNKYIGEYAYNGEVVEREDGHFELFPEKLDIDDMLAEFKAYVDYVLGGDSVKFDDKYTPAGYYERFENMTDEVFYKDASVKNPEVNFENFIYASGSVALPENNSAFKANILNKESKQYKALAAVNELQYAYTTDTGILSSYLGYSVSLGDTTGYIKEFEVAAQEAIANGPGAFTVCPGDYGWHIIYVTYTFNNEGGEEYQPNFKENAKIEGTFENLFYEWVKNNNISNISSTRRTQIITQFNKDNTVTKYQERYQDLLDMDKK